MANDGGLSARLAQTHRKRIALPVVTVIVRGVRNSKQRNEGSGIRARAIKLDRSNYFFLRAAFLAFFAFLFFAMTSSFSCNERRGQEGNPPPRLTLFH
jgi:hypothetical protein